MHTRIGDLLEKRAYLTPDKIGYIDESGARFTFLELNERCNRIANTLIDRGLSKGERVALLLMNSSEFLELFFALGKIGCVTVPLNWRLVPDELEFILKDSGATKLVFSDEFAESVTELHVRGAKTDIVEWLHVTNDGTPLPFALDYHTYRDAGASSRPVVDVQLDDKLYIMYTSGTTGLPKGVVHTHKTSFYGVLTIAANTYFREDDSFLSPLPMFHVGALTPLTISIYRGIAPVVMRSFDPITAWELIERERVTTGLLVPAMMNFMLQVPNLERFEFSRWRWCMTGAAPVPHATIQAFSDLGIDVMQVYGLTESCGPACLSNGKESLDRPGTTGRSFFHTDVAIVRADGSTCEANEPGEVLVKGEHVMREYWHRPDATKETLVDGWLHTGDIATMDEDGYVYIQDRLKDMIISGGENVYPAEIENLILTLEGVKDCGVIGQPSERWGESPFALIVREDASMNEATVMNFLDGKLARFKMPCGAAFVDEIPRNPSGKILKRILREQYPGPAPV
ncbi:MAG: long-chain-fatty-acid--CoA ligase [Gammaproteobacteria bacterium]|nr:long-chain-fatty-acid--CoA ligase [Gammaproteobacteria bacterium]